jgi:hypothetical protein
MKAGTANLAFDITFRPVKYYFDDIVEMGLRLKF